MNSHKCEKIIQAYRPTVIGWILKQMSLTVGIKVKNLINNILSCKVDFMGNNDEVRRVSCEYIEYNIMTTNYIIY